MSRGVSSYIKCLSLTNDIDQCLQGLFQWRFRVVAMAVEDVHIIQMHALETLVKTCHQIFTRTPIAIRSWPHVVTGFSGYEELVAIRTEIVVHQFAQCLFSCSVWRPVVIGKVEMCDAMVECIMSDSSTAFVWVNGTKVLPKAQTNLGQQYATLTATTIQAFALVVPMSISYVA